MKVFAFLLFLSLLTGFSACENHMDINDVVEGTPTRADTVLAHKYPPFIKKDTLKGTSLPKIYRR
jgi:hypothetical protein